ncbi:MAG TPA: sodium:proton antiporter [Candidatus Krumholzibacteria bacterium]|nr:sodium:proton antiporter [Candidatus Krumholzibacteria bacterium]
MHIQFDLNPALIVSLALAAGVVAQSLARHLRIPGIVLLLGAGIALGPDLAGVVRPADLGIGLEILTGFAVAVILFDGGLNLNFRRMRSQAPVIQRLLTVGVVVTVGGAAAAAHLLLGWGWTPSVLFGTLVIVTGPTVITPLLRRIRVRRSVETILETEGVLIDAVGAVVAVVALEIVLGRSLTAGAISGPMRLAVGLVVGLAGGALMAGLLRWPRAVPEGHETIFTLAMTLALYQVANALASESGIMAAITAGAVVGNAGARSEREIKAFKEHLTTLLIGMLFVLLAADVRVADVLALGRPGLLVVLALMFAVRPLNVLLCTAGTGLPWREKAFLAWVAPRGIVAAAMAALFAERLSEHGDAVGTQLRALVFLVIGATVVAQGATAGLMARALRVRRPAGQGFVLFGAGPLGRLLARLLGEHGQEAVLIDNDAGHCRRAQAEGLRVVYGNALDERVMLRSQMDTRRAALGVTADEAVNLLFTRLARQEAKVPAVYLVGSRTGHDLGPEHFRRDDARLLFGAEIDPELWSVRIRRGATVVEAWRREDDAVGVEATLPAEQLGLLVPLFLVDRQDRLEPVDDASRFTRGRTVLWLVLAERGEDARAWLAGQGWAPAAATATDDGPAPAAAAKDGAQA